MFLVSDTNQTKADFIKNRFMVNGQKEAKPGAKRRSVLIDIYPSWEEMTDEFVKCRPYKKPIATANNVQNELQVRPLKMLVGRL